MHIHDNYEPIRPLVSRCWKTDLRSVTSLLWKPGQRTDYTYFKKEATSRKGEANVVGVRNVIKTCTVHKGERGIDRDRLRP